MRKVLRKIQRWLLSGISWGVTLFCFTTFMNHLEFMNVAVIKEPSALVHRTNHLYGHHYCKELEWFPKNSTGSIKRERMIMNNASNALRKSATIKICRIKSVIVRIDFCWLPSLRSENPIPPPTYRHIYCHRKHWVIKNSWYRVNFYKATTVSCLTVTPQLELQLHPILWGYDEHTGHCINLNFYETPICQILLGHRRGSLRIRLDESFAWETWHDIQV